MTQTEPALSGLVGRRLVCPDAGAPEGPYYVANEKLRRNVTIAWWDVTSLTPNGYDITIVWNASGLFAF